MRNLPVVSEALQFIKWIQSLIPWAAYENVIITTRSSAEAFPSALRQKRKTQTKHHEKGDQGTLVSDNRWMP